MRVFFPYQLPQTWHWAVIFARRGRRGALVILSWSLGRLKSRCPKPRLFPVRLFTGGSLPRQLGAVNHRSGIARIVALGAATMRTGGGTATSSTSVDDGAHVNRSEIIQMVARKEGIAQDDVTKVVNSFIDTMGLCLATGESVNLRTFGKFEPRTRKATTRMNPKTREPMAIPDRESVTFVPSPNLKERLNRRSTSSSSTSSCGSGGPARAPSRSPSRSWPGTSTPTSGP
jgi:nucleoid DNA-binding protein